MKSLLLAKEGNYSLLALLGTDGEVYEYAVVSSYKAEKHFGEQWDAGHYFNNIDNAINYFITKKGKPNYYRLEEIATQALHWIEDIYDDLEDFDYENDIFLDKEEHRFFGLDKYF